MPEKLNPHERVISGRALDDVQAWPERIDAVTLADLQAFARRYFQRAARTQLIVGPGISQGK